MIKISRIGGIGKSSISSNNNKNPSEPPAPYLRTNIKTMWVNSTFKIYSNVNWIIIK